MPDLRGLTEAGDGEVIGSPPDQAQARPEHQVLVPWNGVTTWKRSLPNAPSSLLPRFARCGFPERLVGRNLDRSATLLCVVAVWRAVDPIRQEGGPYWQ